MKRIRDTTLHSSSSSSHRPAGIHTPGPVAVGTVSPAVTQQPVAVELFGPCNTRGGLLGDERVTPTAQRRNGNPLAYADDRRVPPCACRAKPGTSDSHETGASNSHMHQDLPSSEVPAWGLSHGSSPWAPAAAYVAARLNVRQPRRLTLVSRKGMGMTRLTPLTGEVMTAISDGSRALNVLFLADGVVDEREFGVLRLFRHAQALAVRSDWSRKARQSVENHGYVNPQLEREYRELETDFGGDAA